MSLPTRQRLTEAAANRFYRDGFRNVGIEQVLADVGISKTAFYKHFDSKDDLMLAVLEMMNHRLQELLRAVTDDPHEPNPTESLRRLFDVVERIITADEYRGCFFVNVVMEFPLAHEPAHQAAAAHKRAIEAIVRELAEQAGAHDPEAMAQDLCLIMEGAYVTRQVTDDPRSIAIARRVAEAVIAARLPLGAEASGAGGPR